MTSNPRSIYSTRSASLVGDYLMTYGNLIKTMDLAKDARILEIGSGLRFPDLSTPEHGPQRRRRGRA